MRFVDTRFSITVFLLVLLIGPSAAFAQFENKAMAVGSLSNMYSETGGQQEYWNNGPYGLQWPAIAQQGRLRADALWIAATNVDGEDGTTYPHRVVHVGPRATGAGEFFPVEFTTTSRFEPPEVTVDGFDSFQFDPDNDEVDPSIAADRIIESRANTLLGVTLTKRVHAFSQEYHDNYHVQEYILTNTGNTDDDEEVELEQTVEGVYLHFQKRYVYNERTSIPGSGWGANVMNDIVGDGMEDYETDLSAQYTWLGNSQNANIDPLGGPAWTDNNSWQQPGDDQGRLTAPQFVGTVTLHADASATDESNDPAQPSTTGHIDADDPLTSNNDAFDAAKMQREYDMLSQGHMYPHHADIVDLDEDFTTPDGEPMIGKAGGWTSMFSFGPYTLAPGEDVRIVIAEGADGLTRSEAMEIGRQFKQAANEDPAQATTELATTPNITYRGVTLSKNDWFFTGRDSLFHTFERAMANFQSGFSIPQPPAPPSSFTVTSGVNQVTLEWTYEGGDPPGGFEIYRAQNFFEGPVEDDFQYTLIHQASPSERSFDDTDVTRGINYFYYIQAVGDVNNDGTAMTPTGQPLKSSRYYTQTYDPASLKRPPGETTDDFAIVPNPYNIASDREVRWPDQQDKLGFLDIPGQCTIRIYTERGDLVETIEHTDGSGDDFWDLTTTSRQVVVSGLYIAVIDNHETGERVAKKFVIIR